MSVCGIVGMQIYSEHCGMTMDRGYGRPKLLMKQELKTDYVVGHWQQGKRERETERRKLTKYVGNLSKNLKILFDS